MVGNYNYGYIALPLVIALFDANTLGVLFLHNVGVEIGLWTVGLMILRGKSADRLGWRQLCSAPIVAVFLGLFLHFSALASLMPPLAIRGLEFLGNCAVPLALILTGAILCDFRKELNFTKQWSSTAWGAALRLSIIPIFFLVLAWLLPCRIELKKVLIVQAAMPAAMLPIVLTRLHGGDVELALRQVVVTSLISFATIPLVIQLGLKWLKLD